MVIQKFNFRFRPIFYFNTLLGVGFFAVLSFFSPLSSATEKGFDHSHQVWTGLLERNLDSKKFVRYKRLKEDKKENKLLQSYLKSLSNVKKKEFDSFDKPDQLAFLINAYNAFTVELILKHYPVKSIKKIGGFFTKPWSIDFFSLLGGAIKDLDSIEHKWIRPKYKDYRIHAAVNCASVSCPVLRAEAYVGSKISVQLDEQMKIWLNDSSRNQVGAKSLQLSKIFDWYEEDFVKWGKGVSAVVEKYSTSPPKNIKKLPIKYLSYDWDLNEAKK